MLCITIQDGRSGASFNYAETHPMMAIMKKNDGLKVICLRKLCLVPTQAPS